VTNYVGNIGGPFLLGGYSGPFVPLNPMSTYTGNGQYQPVQYQGGQSAGTIGFQAVTDGTSNTALWSEAVSGSKNPVFAGSGRVAEFRTFFQAGTQSNFNNLPTGPTAGAAVTQFIAQCNSVPNGTNGAPGSIQSPRGTNWQATFPYYASWGMYNHVSSPNSRQCANIQYASSAGGGQLASVVDVYGTAPPTSFHLGGVNVAMCDGSVRFIRDQINLFTWWYIGTRASNEPINANSL